MSLQKSNPHHVTDGGILLHFLMSHSAMTHREPLLATLNAGASGRPHATLALLFRPNASATTQ